MRTIFGKCVGNSSRGSDVKSKLPIVTRMVEWKQNSSRKRWGCRQPFQAAIQNFMCDASIARSEWDCQRTAPSLRVHLAVCVQDRERRNTIEQNERFSPTPTWRDSSRGWKYFSLSTISTHESKFDRFIKIPQDSKTPKFLHRNSTKYQGSPPSPPHDHANNLTPQPQNVLVYQILWWRGRCSSSRYVHNIAAYLSRDSSD